MTSDVQSSKKNTSRTGNRRCALHATVVLGVVLHSQRSAVQPCTVTGNINNRLTIGWRNAETRRSPKVDYKGRDTVECGYAGHAAAGLQGANMILAKVNDQSVVVFEHRLTNIGMK